MRMISLFSITLVYGIKFVENKKKEQYNNINSTGKKDFACPVSGLMHPDYPNPSLHIFDGVIDVSMKFEIEHNFCLLLSILIIPNFGSTDSVQ